MYLGRGWIGRIDSIDDLDHVTDDSHSHDGMERECATSDVSPIQRPCGQ